MLLKLELRLTAGRSRCPVTSHARAHPRWLRRRQITTSVWLQLRVRREAGRSFRQDSERRHHTGTPPEEEIVRRRRARRRIRWTRSESCSAGSHMTSALGRLRLACERGPWQHVQPRDVLLHRERPRLPDAACGAQVKRAQRTQGLHRDPCATRTCHKVRGCSSWRG